MGMILLKIVSCFSEERHSDNDRICNKQGQKAKTFSLFLFNNRNYIFTNLNLK